MEVNFFIRPRVTIKTQYGERVLVNFHLDTPSPAFFKWEDLKPKRTLAIFYAVNRTFMDLNQGIRQENPRTVLVFPCPLDSLMDEFQGYVWVEKRAKACFYCGKLESDDHKLLKCIRCKNAFYCGRDCQSPHFTKSHKNLCRFAPMLANLSKLDFSRFDDFVDWNFPPIVPPTAKEKEEKAKKAIREAFYSIGATTTTNGASMHNQVDEFLSLIADKDPSSAIQLLCHDASPLMTMLNEGGLPRHIRDTFLFKSLKEFTCAVAANPHLRHHVVDLKFERSGGHRSRIIHEFTGDTLLSALFAAFPLWQHEVCINGVEWSFESHYPTQLIKGAFKSNVWRIHEVDDSLFVKNRVSGTSFFMSDDMKLVADMSEIIAHENPGNIVIRIIRVTANEFWSDCVRSIATQDNLSSNIYTLWIREDVALCGRFNPLNPDMSLVEQLLDRRELSIEDLLLDRLGINDENIFSRDSSATESHVCRDEQACVSCGQFKTKECFSITQRRKYGNKARCKECVALSSF